MPNAALLRSPHCEDWREKEISLYFYKMGRAAADSRSKSNRIAALNAATPRAGSHLPEAQRPFEPETANQSLSLGVPKGPFSRVREWPL